MRYVQEVDWSREKKQRLKSSFGKVAAVLSHCALCPHSSQNLILLEYYSFFGTRNHEEQCQVSREPGIPAECRVWSGKSGPGVVNEVEYCHDATDIFLQPTVLGSCIKMHHEHNRGFLSSTPY